VNAALRSRRSGQTPATPANVQEQARIAQHLQLLADFVPHMPVIGMEFLQFAGQAVNVLVFELHPAKPPHDIQYVQSPATLRGFDFANAIDTKSAV